MKVKCEFWEIPFTTGTIYTCKVTEAEITSKLKEIKCFEGVHQRGKSSADVKGVYFIGTKVHYVPLGLQKHFPNLTNLDIYNCGLKKVTQEDLRGLEGLVALRLPNNQLTSVPDNLLSNLANLRLVNLNDNQLEFESSGFLKPLVGRANVQVHLLRNTKINLRFAPGSTDSLNSLEELMEMIDKKDQKPAAIRCEAEHKTFDQMIKEMWISGRFSDFTIFAGEQEFKTHKIILGMQSSVFAKIIEEHKDASEIKIHDFTPKAVEALLHFLYTGKIQDNENAKENFSIASKFQIAGMKSIYEEILCNQLEGLDVYEIFLLAHQHSAEILKARAFNMISSKESLLTSNLPKHVMENSDKLKKAMDMRREYENLLKE